MAAPIEIEATAARVAAGPGAMLKKAREAAGMPLDELARRTRLELKVLTAIESEAWDRLAGPAFIKGYIRGIARELGIDPAVPLAEYNAQFHTGEPVLSDFESRAPLELTSASRWIKSTSYALAVVVVVLIALWWQHNYMQSAPPSGPTGLAEPSVPPADPGTPLPYAWTVVEHAGLPLETPQTWRRQTDGSAPPPLNAAVEATVDAPAPAAGANGSQKPPAAPPAAASAPKPAVTPAAPAAQDEPTNDAPPSGDLIIKTSKDSWVRVRDVRGRELFSGVVKGGRTIGLSGRAPLDLVIGNAPEVAVSFRGEPQNLSNHSINGVARLTVGDVR